MTHPTFPLHGYERFFAMDRDASAKMAHVLSLHGDVATLQQYLPEAVLQTFNRHPKMRVVLLPGVSPQKAMVCSPLVDISELKSLFSLIECSACVEDSATDANDSESESPSLLESRQPWMALVQSECEKPLDREKEFPFYLRLWVDSASPNVAQLVLFADQYMSDAVSGAVILRETLETAVQLSTAVTAVEGVEMEPKMPLVLRESLFEASHYVSSWMSLVHGAVSKFVMQPLINFDTDAFRPLLPVQTDKQRDFVGSPPSPPNPSFALFAHGSEDNMCRAIARCQAEGVSLQGALVAVTTMAFGLAANGGTLRDCVGPLQLRMDVVADMRKQVSPKPMRLPSSDSNESQLSDELQEHHEALVGLYSTPANLVFTSSEGVDPHTLSFWDVARKADHERACALLSHELKLQSVFVNETLNAERSGKNKLRVANCALSDTTLSYLDCSPSASNRKSGCVLPRKLKVGTADASVVAEDLYVYASQPSLGSTTKLYVTALSRFDYTLMHKLQPEMAPQLLNWMVRCTESIGDLPTNETLAQAAERFATTTSSLELEAPVVVVSESEVKMDIEVDTSLPDADQEFNATEEDVVVI